MSAPRTPLLLLPGTLCTEATFAAQETALSDLAETSVHPLTGADTTEGYAEALLAAAPDRFALAGFSQGAIVALAVVRRAPERVTRLALLACNPGPPRPEQLATWLAWADEARRDGVGRIAELLAGNVHPSRRGDLELRRTIVAMAQATPVEAFAGQLTALATRPDARPGLSAIRCPTLLLVGADDPVTPPELHRDSAARIPGARLELLERCGHYAPLERPAEVSAALRRWLLAGSTSLP